MSSEPTDPVRSNLRMYQGVLLWAVTIAMLLTMVFAMAFIPPVAIIGVIYLALGFAVIRWREKTWVSILGAVLALVGIIANFPFLSEDLAHPESWGSFIPASLSVIAGVGSAVMSVLSLRPTTQRAAMNAMLGVVGLASVAAVFSLGLWVIASDDEAEPGDVEVIAEGIEYPETLTMSATSTGIAVENRDQIRHTFVIESQNVKIEVPALKTRRTDVSLPAGTYDYVCDVPGHERMEGVLTVQ